MKKINLVILLSLILCSLMIFVGCTKDNILSTPQNIEYNIDNELTWSPVENAGGYYVEIINADTQEDKSLTVKRGKTNVSLSFLSEGDYVIRIKATPRNTSTLDSAFSEKIYFEKKYETGCVYELINNDTEYQIKKFGNAPAVIYIEDEYRNKPVTAIAERAFKGYQVIEEVYIGNNVKSIGDNAFYNCKNLKVVEFGESVEYIGASAFQSCGLLTEIVIPKAIKTIYSSTFAYCRELTTLTLPEGLHTIEGYAFADCSALTGVVLPNSLTSLGEYAFSGNSQLSSLTIGSSLEEVSNAAFYRCINLANITFADNSSLKTINTNAFRDCYALTQVILPDGVEKIGKWAFCMQSETRLDSDGNEYVVYPSQLTTIKIPSSVISVGKQAFFGTKSYVDSYFSRNDYIYIDNWLVECLIKNNVSSGANGLKELREITAKTFKDDLIGIADGVFESSVLLEKVQLATSIKHIGESSFASCLKLRRFESLENGLETIGQFAFMGCEILSDLILNEGLKEIGSFAFYGCKRLNTSTTNVLCPNTIVSIGRDAFAGTKVFEKFDDFGVVYVENWIIGYDKKDQITSVELKEETIGIADYAFAKCPDLASLIIPQDNNLTYLGRGVFYSCSKLASIDLSNTNIKVIDEYTFYMAVALFDVKLPMGLTEIGKSSFSKCESLISIDLSNRPLVSIGEYAFYNAIELKEVNFGIDNEPKNQTLTTIGMAAFYRCSALTEVKIPNSVKQIGSHAFFRCKNLEELTLGSNIENIGDYAFAHCKNIKKITFGAGLKSIGNYAFYNCESLLIINFNDKIESVGDYAFFGAKKVARLNLPKSLSKIGNYAFAYAQSVTCIILTDNIEVIGNCAFYGCNNATFYTNADKILGKWDKQWNASYRPIVWGCTFDEDGRLTSVTILDETLGNTWQLSGFGAPEYVGYRFMGWATQPDGKVVYSMDQIMTVPVGTTLYAVWQ